MTMEESGGPVGNRIRKRDMPHLINLLISNNFSFMRFFAQRVYYELSVVKVYDSQPIFY